MKATHFFPRVKGRGPDRREGRGHPWEEMRVSSRVIRNIFPTSCLEHQTNAIITELCALWRRIRGCVYFSIIIFGTRCITRLGQRPPVNLMYVLRNVDSQAASNSSIG